MYIPFRALVLSAGLMLSTVAYADVSSLDPEQFLDPHEQETIAIIAADLARAGETVAATTPPQEPDVVAALEPTLPPEPQPEAAALAVVGLESGMTEAAAPELDHVEATGSLPVLSEAAADPALAGRENDQLAMTSQIPVDPTDDATEAAQDTPAISLP